jgi:hypothetical protein
MEDFQAKYDDLLNRGYDISFYENENYNLFTQNLEKVFYVSIKKDGSELFHFPSRISSKEAFLNAYNLIPRVEKLFNRT